MPGEVVFTSFENYVSGNLDIPPASSRNRLPSQIPTVESISEGPMRS